MSQRNVELFVGRLITDEAFRDLFCREPVEAVNQMAGEGVHLTCIEVEALTRIDPTMARLFAEALDPRIQKIDARRRPA